MAWAAIDVAKGGCRGGTADGRRAWRAGIAAWAGSALAVLPALAALALPGAAAAADKPVQVSFGTGGLAPAKAGQTLAQAEKALQQALQAESATADLQACHYRRADAWPGVRFAFDRGLLTRAETRDARHATARGLHVGDDVDRARQAYGKKLLSAPHPYFAKGLTLTVQAADRRSALVMESNDEGRIITLRGGRLPEVMRLEACS